MADDVRSWIINSILIGVFFICIITFAVQLGSNYGKSSSQMIGNQTGVTSLERQMNQTAKDATTWQSLFLSDNILAVLGSLVLFSVWGLFKLIFGSVITFLVIYLDLVSSILHIPTMVIGSITAIVIITLIFLGWRLIKQGQ